MNRCNEQITPPILSLGDEFYDPVIPAQFQQAIPRFLNQNWAQKIGLNLPTEALWIEHFAHFLALPNNLSEPLALRYHGHQFHHYNPELGDGRGFLFAQVKSGGKLYDLGTKGSGQTPYSRSGDGRLTLKGAFREALATELLESLGVNTSKTFCFFETGESLIRHDEPSPTRAAVLTRLSHGHIRIGSFQRLAYLQQRENINKLTHYAIENYYPEITLSDSALENAENLLHEFTKRLADLTASLMTAGFVHGVLNTDNINLSGELFDYGPYRFLPNYDTTFTAAYFDHQGLYSYGNQPHAMFWNLQRLAEVLQWAHQDLKIELALQKFAGLLEECLIQKLMNRLNLAETSAELMDNLIPHLFEFLEQNKAPFERTFFDLYGMQLEPRWQSSPASSHYQSESGRELIRFLEKWTPKKQSLEKYFLRQDPCTLIIEELEDIWSPIAQNDDWQMFHKKIDDIRSFRGIYL